MGQFDLTLGAMMLGTWVNSMLYMTEMVQIIRFLLHYKGNGVGVKVLLAVMWIVDTVGTIGGYATVYIYTVTFWGNANALLLQYWSYPMYCAATGTSSTLVQGFLIYRIRQFSKSWLLPVPLALISASSLAGAYWTAVGLVQHPTYAERPLLVPPVTLWLVASTVCDVVIAVCLVYQFRKVSSSFESTQTLLRRLMHMSIRTGAVTSLFALLVLAIFLQNNQSTVAVGFNFCLGRVYALTLLHNLNSRQDVAQESSRSATSKQAVRGDGRHPSHPAIDLSQIRVDKSVHRDHDTVYDGSKSFFSDVE